MNDFHLISVKELCKRWGKSETTIRNYISDGTIQPCKGVPGMMFHPDHIMELEGVEPKEISLSEFRRLKKENETLRKENEQLKKDMFDILRISSKVGNYIKY